MRFFIRMILLAGLLSVLTMKANAYEDRNVEKNPVPSINESLRESYAAEKRVHRKLLRALGVQNLPKQASIDALGSEDAQFEVKLVPAKVTP